MAPTPPNCAIKVTVHNSDPAIAPEVHELDYDGDSLILHCSYERVDIELHPDSGEPKRANWGVKWTPVGR
jgi:hypothetical protein